MKLQCELCKEIVPAEFTVAGTAIAVTCPACKGSFQAEGRGEAPVVELARPRAARRAPAAGEPVMTCPKCHDAQPPGAACRSCGLLGDRMAEFVRDRDAQVPPEVVAAWDELGATWSEDAAHDKFVRIASTAMAYPWAALRYREAIRLRPDDAVAAAQLARLARMAEVTLLATATRKPVPGAKPYRKVIILLVTFLALAVIGVVYAIMSTDGATERPAARPGAPAKASPKAAPKPPGAAKPRGAAPSGP